jgi:hypothetical protein
MTTPGLNMSEDPSPVSWLFSFFPSGFVDKNVDYEVGGSLAGPLYAK